MFALQKHARATLALGISWSAGLTATVYAGHPAEIRDVLPLPELAQNTSAPALTAEPSLTDAAELPPARKLKPSDSLALNLIKRMVQHGLLPQAEADELVSAAEAETQAARAEEAALQERTIGTAIDRAVAGVQQQMAATSDADLFAASAHSVRVPYLPESVRAQMREEVKEDVMAQAQKEHWAAPNAVPSWAQHFRLFGDVRLRGEGDFFGGGNDNTGAFPNFNAINTGAPFDIAGTTFPPFLNVDKNRERIRLRVRAGAEADLGSGFTAGLMVATGETNSPVSTNQSVGLAGQGQGANFSNYNIWLDRGFLRYTQGKDPERQVALSLGRFENPFYSTQIIFDDDLGFDGAALQGRYRLRPGLVPFFSAGAFPIFNTDFNFSSNQPGKFRSQDKWMYGTQLGANRKLGQDFELKLAGSYYYYQNVSGRLSTPFLPLSPSDQGNTDDSRPSFAQKGNTYLPLRRIIASPLNNFGTANQFQYYGLATPFRDLAVTGELNYNHWEPFQLSLSWEWVKNLGFDRNRLEQLAVNNRGPDLPSGAPGRFAGGDTAWIVGLSGGHPLLQKRGDWKLGVNYRYVESDSVIDGLNDSEFGLGGTNLKGYTLFGALALSPKVSLACAG